MTPQGLIDACKQPVVGLDGEPFLPDHMSCVAQNLRGLTHFRSNADDIDALADDRDALRMALEAMMGVFDTPISRRKISGEYAQEARKMGRAALSPKETSK